jgi:hypothetical protein
MATDVSVSPVLIRARGNDKEFAYLLDNAKLDLVAHLAARRPLPVFVVDLRRYKGSERAVGQLLTFNRFCEVSGTKLVTVVGPSRVRDTIAEFHFERTLGICDAAGLQDHYGIDADAPDPNELETPPPPTAAEIQKMRDEGVTFADAILEIEPLLRAE